MVRAKELFTWTPSFESIKEQDYSSEDESVQGVGSKENKYNTYEKERSMEHSVHWIREISSADPRRQGLKINLNGSTEMEDMISTRKQKSYGRFEGRQILGWFFFHLNEVLEW
ncbi:hypothetical protein Tco_0363234 [Tanacetum coccineum]